MMQFASWREGELQGDSGFASIVMHHSDRTSSLTNVSAMFENENSYFLTGTSSTVMKHKSSRQSWKTNQTNQHASYLESNDSFDRSENNQKNQLNEIAPLLYSLNDQDQLYR
jgi:hypothetical protein